MKAFLAATLLTTALLTPAQTARADDDQDVCTYYGNVGAATVDFLMPLSFRQVMALIGGRDDNLAKNLDGRLKNLQTPQIKAVLEHYGKDAASLLGESAGFQAFQMAVSGRANEGGQIFMAMTNACQQMGPMTIIENQRKKRKQSQPDTE